MPRVILFVALLGLHIYVLTDIVKAPGDYIRTLPKSIWLFVSLVPLLGPLFWVLGGRPLVGPGYGNDSGGGGSGGIRGGPRPGKGPIAPDDDPEFLKRLDEQSWAARMERLRRERQAGGQGGGPSEGPLPGEQNPSEPPSDRV